MEEKEKRLVSIIRGDGTPIIAKKINRNEKCKCGSGKKAKKCCGVETRYFSTKKQRTYQKK